MSNDNTQLIPDRPPRAGYKVDVENEIGIKNSSDSVINPATEETLQQVKTAVEGITLDTTVLATETTLGNIKTQQTDGSQKTQIVTDLGTVGGFDNSGDIHLLVHDDIVDSTLSGIASNLTDVATETTLGALNTKIGEVQDVPTANTVLGRLNLIEDDINTITGDGVFMRDVTGNKIYPATTNDVYQLELLESAIYASVGATLGSDATAIKTAVQLLDNAVDGNYINVNNNIAGTDVAAGAGTVNAQTQRVTLGSNDPAVTALQAIDSSVKTYALQYAVDSGDSTITYVGKAVAGSTLASASWQIKQITDTSGDLSILFADGDTLFNNVWNNRESLTYS